LLGGWVDSTESSENNPTFNSSPSSRRKDIGLIVSRVGVKNMPDLKTKIEELRKYFSDEFPGFEVVTNFKQSGERASKYDWVCFEFRPNSKGASNHRLRLGRGFIAELSTDDIKSRLKKWDYKRILLFVGKRPVTVGYNGI
jgi:hypothetical protein